MAETKEDGTNHYRSGIYDVVSVAAKHRARTSNVIVKEEYSDMREVLLRLTANVEENTKAIRALHAHLNAGGDRSTRRRKDRVTVYLRVAFLRIIDVDTKEGTYTADVFIQASWLEPALQSASQQELDDMDYDLVWKPNIMVTNLAGTPEHMQRWYGGGRYHRDQTVPLLYLRIALRAKFKENLQLSSFPIDTQALSVTVGSERSEAEVNFEEDLATVNMDTFTDQSEFTLHPHVEVERKQGDIHGGDLYSRCPKLNFACHVTRRPGFYFWNMFLILFLITGLLFTAYIFSPDESDHRMKISLTLLLVAVAYKLVMIKEMPRLPFMSYMGGYMLACILFLIWQNLQNAIIGVVASGSGVVYANEVDRYMFAVLCFLYIFFNVVYLSVILIKYYLGLGSMNTKNENYQNKMKGRDSAKGYANPAYYQHDHSYTMPKNMVEPSTIREDRPRRKSKKIVEYADQPEYIVKEPDYDEAIKNTVVKSHKNKEIKSRAREGSDTVYIGASEA